MEHSANPLSNTQPWTIDTAPCPSSKHLLLPSYTRLLPLVFTQPIAPMSLIPTGAPHLNSSWYWQTWPETSLAYLSVCNLNAPTQFTNSPTAVVHLFVFIFQSVRVFTLSFLGIGSASIKGRGHGIIVESPSTLLVWWARWGTWCWLQKTEP